MLLATKARTATNRASPAVKAPAPVEGTSFGVVLQSAEFFGRVSLPAIGQSSVTVTGTLAQSSFWLGLLGLTSTAFTQAVLAEEDRDLAGNILTLYDKRLTADMNPLEKKNALENTVKRKILRYSETFVGSGINATGMPTLWKAFKIAAKVVLPI